MPNNPEVNDAPVGKGKALRDPPSANTVVVDPMGLRRGHEARSGNEILGRRPEGSLFQLQGRRLPGRLHQRAGLRRQTGTGMYDLHPGRVAARVTTSRLLISE